MSSLRILIGAETYPPDVNGAANFAERLATGLARRGHDVHVVAPSPVGEPITTYRAGVTVHGDLGRVYRQADVVTAPTPRAVELLASKAGLTDAFAVRHRRRPLPRGARAAR